MITDPLFYIMAIPAIIIVGMSKSGFGGGLTVIAVPLLSLAAPPREAAAILLPILCVMDVATLWKYRGKYDRHNFKIMVPASLVGVAIGCASFKYLDDNFLRIITGLIAVIFTINFYLKRKSESQPKKGTTLAGSIWGCIAGFTSFSCHAGGPPANIYLLPQKLDKTILVGTIIHVFIIINYTKLIPYYFLGRLNFENLGTSLVISPLAIVGIALGLKLHHKIKPQLFYKVCYTFLFLAGLNLLYKGIRGTFF